MNAVSQEILERARNGDREAAERFLEDNSGLIWSVVKRFYGRGVEPEDLFQLGCIGMLKAVHGYEPTYGTCFSTYAVPKISGEIRRFIRDDGLIKVSRTMKERSSAIKMERQSLTAILGREPTIKELAEKMNITPEEIASAELATGSTESLQRETGEEGFSLELTLTKGNLEEQMIEHIDLERAMGLLSQKERQVLQLRYFHCLTQEKTAGIVGVSQVQVSRIEHKAIVKLRRLL